MTETDTIRVNVSPDDSSVDASFQVKNLSDTTECYRYVFEIDEEDLDLILASVLISFVHFTVGVYDACENTDLYDDCLQSQEIANLGLESANVEEFINSDKEEVLTHFSAWTTSGCDSLLFRRPILFTKVLSHTDDAVPLQLNIFPNPAGNYIKINGNEHNLLYTISSISGKLIQQGRVDSNTIKTSKLMEGLYFLKLMDSKGRAITKRVIKSN